MFSASDLSGSDAEFWTKPNIPASPNIEVLSTRLLDPSSGDSRINQLSSETSMNSDSPLRARLAAFNYSSMVKHLSFLLLSIMEPTLP